MLDMCLDSCVDFENCQYMSIDLAKSHFDGAENELSEVVKIIVNCIKLLMISGDVDELVMTEVSANINEPLGALVR